jgi:KRAB domain-containing zinc finger protein
MHFIIFSLILVSGHRIGDKEVLTHIVCLEEVSHLMTPEVGPPTQKTHPCDICGPVLKGILNLAAPFVQKLYMTIACASSLQRDHTAENPLKRDMDRTLFEKHCEFFMSGKWFNFNDLWKDFSVFFDLL